MHHIIIQKCTTYQAINRLFVTNAYLKEMADICGIKTRITFHIARHTFASTVTLENGVPIDSVSKMLGNRSIKTTQIYAKVSDRKISQDTEILFRKLQK